MMPRTTNNSLATEVDAANASRTMSAPKSTATTATKPTGNALPKGPILIESRDVSPSLDSFHNIHLTTSNVEKNASNNGGGLHPSAAAQDLMVAVTLLK